MLNQQAELASSLELNRIYDIINTMPDETTEISNPPEPIESIYTASTIADQTNKITKIAPNVPNETTSEFLFNSFINEVDVNNNSERVENKNLCQQQQQPNPIVNSSESNQIEFTQYGPVNMYDNNNPEYLGSDLVKSDMIALDPKLQMFNSSVIPSDLKLSDFVSTDPDYRKDEDELVDEYTHLSKKHQQLKKYKRQSSTQDSNDNNNNKIEEMSTQPNTKLLDIQAGELAPENQSQNPNIFLLDMSQQQQESDGTDDGKNTVGASGENRVNSTKVESTQLSEKIPKLFTVKTHKKSKTLPPYATMIMNEWYEAHKDKPYPTEAERAEMAEKGDLNENQVKAWFANKRNRSSRATGIVKKKAPNNSSSANTAQAFTTSSTSQISPLVPENKIKPTTLVDVAIKSEKNENSTQILTLLNGPIMLQNTPSDINTKQHDTKTSSPQVKKTPKRKLTKAASAASNEGNKVKKPVKIQPMIQPRPPPVMPLTVDTPGQFKTNKGNVHMVAIQPSTPVVTPPMQYYHSMPESMHKPMSFVHAPNFTGYSMDTSGPNLSQSPSNQMLDENTYQQTLAQHYHHHQQQQQQMYQPIQTRPMQAQQKMQQKHQLQLQLQQLVHQKQQQQNQFQQQQQQQQHHQQLMQQQTQQQNPKLTWEHQQQQQHFFNPCFYPTKPQANLSQNQYQPNFPRNYQEVNNFFGTNEGPSLMPQLEQMAPFQNIPTPNSIHSASSLTSTFNFNEPYSQTPAIIYQRDNQQALMHQQYQQQQQNYQKHFNFSHHPKQCVDPNCSYIVASNAVQSTQPSNQQIPANLYHQSVSQNQPELSYNTNFNNSNEFVSSSIGGQQTQMQLLNQNPNMNQIMTSVPVSAVNSLSTNQQQYQCDTPPPIIKKSTPTNSNQSSSSATPVGSSEDKTNNNSTECMPSAKSNANTSIPTPNSSNSNANNLTWFTENNTILDSNRNLYNIRVSNNQSNIQNQMTGTCAIKQQPKLAYNGPSNMPSPNLNAASIPVNGIQSPMSVNSNMSAPKPTDETSNFALQNLDHISNLNIVNIHPKALENTSVNISISGNQQAFYNRGETEHSDDVTANSAFHQYVSHVQKHQQEQQQPESRFTDSKNKDWCISHHPRLSNTLLNVQIPIQTAAANSMVNNPKRMG